MGLFRLLVVKGIGSTYVGGLSLLCVRGLFPVWLSSDPWLCEGLGLHVWEGDVCLVW